MPDSRKALDRWACDAGWADFDTFVRVGGSVLEAHDTIRQRIDELEGALTALRSYSAAKTAATAKAEAHAPILEHSADAEPPDPDNAHPQGDDAA